MAKVENFTNPLSGHEIIDDVISQIRKRLSTDCNLRAVDGYSGGYSGTVTIQLRMNAVRTREVDMTIPISDGLKGPDVSSFPQDGLLPAEVDEVIEIPLEENLQAVRKRTIENTDEADAAQGQSTTDPVELAPTVMNQKRKYTRHAMAGATSGE